MYLLLERLPRVIAHDADNFTRHFPLHASVFTLDEMLTERSAAVEVSVDEGFVDNSHTRRAFAISLVEITTLQQRDSHVREVVRTGEESIDLHVFTRTRMISLDLNAAPRSAHEAYLRLVDQSRRLHSG